MPAETRPDARLSQAAALECAGFSVRRAARALGSRYDEALRPLGLKSTQFTLLNALHLLGESGVNALAERLLMDRTTLTRNLRPLERRGLVRARPGDDRRTRALTLTADGRAILAAALPLWHAVQRRVEEHLGAARTERLRRDLARLEALD